MQTRITLVVAALLFAAGVAPPSASADSYSFGSDRDEGDGFGWAIVSGGSSSMSGTQDLDSIDDLKAQFGDNFLYVREGRDRYVISDRKLVARAQESAKQIGKYGKEIGELARAQARLAVDRALAARGLDRTDRLTVSDRRDLTRRREEASERLHQGVRQIKREMREILREAKSRGLAERLGR